jgi:hypothetical protein
MLLFESLRQPLVRVVEVVVLNIFSWSVPWNGSTVHDEVNLKDVGVRFFILWQ